MEDLIREVTVPLEIDQIKDFFSNQELKFIVNYHDSELKDVVFLTYLSNLELPAEISFAGCSFEQREKFFITYMNTRSIYNSDTLRLNIANILLTYRGIDTSEMFINPVFNNDEVLEFIEKNEDLVKRWEIFLESTILFSQICLEDINSDVKTEFENIEDPQYVGANIVNLFSIPSFMETFFLVPPKNELKYFRAQFEEYMFRGKNLFAYYDCEENIIFKMFLAHINGAIDMDLLLAAQAEAEQIQKMM